MNVIRSFFLALVLCLTSFRTLVLRLLRGPKHPSWTLPMELWFEGVRILFATSHRFLAFEFQRRARITPRSRALRERVVHQRCELGCRLGEVHQPFTSDADLPTVLYFHGGGYIMCSPGTHREMTSRLAWFSCSRCIVPSYRLAPDICMLEANLHGLPPLLVQSGEAEIFHTQHQALVARARDAQVDVALDTYPGMVHVFQMFGFLPQSRAAMKSIRSFVQACLDTRPIHDDVVAGGWP